MSDRNIHISGVFGVISAIATVVAEISLVGSISLRPVAAGVIGAIAAWIVLALGAQIVRLLRPSPSPQSPAMPSPTTSSSDPMYRGRTFVHRTPNELTAAVRGKTTIARDAINKPFVGLWMQVRGTLVDVTAYSDTVEVEVDYVGPDQRNPSIRLTFKKSDYQAWEALQPGDIVEAIGKIDKILTMWVMLKDCELLRIASPAAPMPRLE